MCGIVGLLSAEPVGEEGAESLVRGMADTLWRRGPDDQGCWVEAAQGVAFGHRRLSILDLSPTGHQPMASASGRYHVTFNGEIYNHLELRSAVAGRWRGTSDTETLLACMESWGVERTLRRLVGMFAFAVWDRHAATLHLVRDRLGEKPLYYGLHRRMLVFASELRALRAVPDFAPELEPAAVASLIRLGYIAGPLSIHAGILKLPAGGWLQVSSRDVAVGRIPEPQTYWSVREAVIAGIDKPFDGSAEDAVIALDDLLRQSVQGQMLADVPVGAFLSGGIDSSLIVATAQSVATRPVATFSMGVDDPRLDESAHAAVTARFLGTEHHEVRVSGSQALQTVEHLCEVWDEPFADSSQIPTLLLSEFASRHVKVALSGDGGDEFFLGYNHYRYLTWLRRLRRFQLPGVTGLLARATERVAPPRAAQRIRTARFASGLLDIDDPDAMIDEYWDMYRGMENPWRSESPRRPRWRALPGAVPITARAAARDAEIYLPDDILVKVDRAAMHHSLETRAPLLDHRIVEFSFSLPQRLKQSLRSGKVILRRALGRRVPAHLFERPKQGFSVPVAKWLRSDLREWAGDLIGASAVVPDGLDMRRVRQIWNEHQAGLDQSRLLWSVLMLLQWRAAQTSQER